MRFRVFGPFAIPRNTNGLISFNKDAKREFWEGVESACEGVSSGCGCYIVAAAGGNGAKPHYVGLTVRRSFRTECSAAHVINHFNEVVAGKSKLRPQLFLIAKLTPTGRFAKPSSSGHADIKFLENYMIGLALDRKPRWPRRRSSTRLSAMSALPRRPPRRSPRLRRSGWNCSPRMDRQRR